MGTTPTDLAIMNSIRTAVQEEEHRVYLSEIGKDLQHLDDDMLKKFDDGAYMIALKRAYGKGVLVRQQYVYMYVTCSSNSSHISFTIMYVFLFT